MVQLRSLRRLQCHPAAGSHNNVEVPHPALDKDSIESAPSAFYQQNAWKPYVGNYKIAQRLKDNVQIQQLKNYLTSLASVTTDGQLKPDVSAPGGSFILHSMTILKRRTKNEPDSGVPSCHGRR